MQTIWDFNYTGSMQAVSLLPGKYKLECWGASGGIASPNSAFTSGALGGYAKGEITLRKRANFNIYVGQSGYERVPRGSSLTRINFNGGGSSVGVYINDYLCSKSGGGATDIRLPHSSTLWDDSKGLLSRILVAGGGGSIDIYGTSSPPPSIGHGGGLDGSDGFDSFGKFNSGGSQYQGGRGYKASYGSFGKGGSGNLCGGGGWFGGAGAYFGDVAGGGSGYALTKDSYKPPGYIPTFEYWLENVVMTNGGNTTRADGYAKITLLQALPLLTVSSYNSTQATFKADHTDPTLLTKIEYFIDDTLKETITTDLTLEKTINYTLEDNALHTLKIVVTDSANATAEKVLTISKGIAPLPAGSSSEDITNKWREIGTTFKTGKTSIINTLALKNIEASLNNTLVELSEKIKTSFDSSDASVQDLMNQLTQSNNTISQLNTKYKVASGRTSTLTDTTSTAYLYVNSQSNPNYPINPGGWINIEGLNFIPNIFFAECECTLNSPTQFYKYLIFATYSIPSLSDKDFVITTALRKTNSDTKFTADSQVYINNRGNTYINNQGVYVPAYRPSVSYTLYNWYAIKFI
ncbi:glycine-rich protein [Clostridioides difficile]